MNCIKHPIATLFFLSICITTQAQPKLVGYVPIYNFRQPDIKQIHVNQLTHLNLAFLRPDSTGAISLPLWVDSLIQMAHAAKVKVLGSIGGGNAPAYYPQLLAVKQRTHFIEQLITAATTHRLDGIDVDLEGEMIDTNYEAFVTELATQLRKENKLITAAVATWTSARITDKALRQFDLVNIMSYDKTGPWTPQMPGPHASYEMAAHDLNHWINERKLPKRKVILGLPFYGYRFGKPFIRSMSYSEIIQSFPQAPGDSIIINDTARIYFNSPATIDAKTKLALQQAGGVMIWQLLQDAEGDKALLNIIHRRFNRH